jgi:hypothetical protein
VSRADEVLIVVDQAWRYLNYESEEKTDEKALIPLPPTGLTCTFCAKPKTVQTILKPKQAAGGEACFHISQFANLGRKMQPACKAGPWMALSWQPL